VSARVVRQPGELRWETRLLVVVTAVLTVFGIASLYAAATMQERPFDYFVKQLSGALAGAVALLIVSQVDYHRWRKSAWPLLLLAVVSLVIVVLPFTQAIAPVTNGARRWIKVGPANFQPSELARFAIVVWTAMLAAKKGDAVRGFKKGVSPFLVIIGLVSVLILIEPNLSMATLVALLGGIVLFTAGAKIGHFMLLGVAALFTGISLIWAEGYRLQRLKCFLEPCEGGDFQLQQALIGFGSGGPFGVGRSVRRRVRPRAAQDELPPLRLFRFSGRDDRRRMGLSWCRRDRPALFHFLLARLPHRQDGARSLRAVPGNRPDGVGRARGAPPWRREPRPHAHDGAGAPLHVLRALGAADCAPVGGSPGQHRARPGKTGQTVRGAALTGGCSR